MMRCVCDQGCVGCMCDMGWMEGGFSLCCVCCRKARGGHVNVRKKKKKKKSIPTFKFG